MPYHNDTIITTQWQLRCRKDNAGKLLYKYFTSQFIARVRKGCLRAACEKMLETEHKLHILTLLLWPSRCVLFSWCWGPLHRGFPRDPSVGCGLPYHIWSLTLWESAGNCFGTPNSTELNNNSTPTRSPTGSLKSNV